MVKNIEELCAELHIQTFSNHRVLVDGQVPLFVGWPRKRVASKITEMASAGYAVVGGAGCPIRLCKGCDRARNRKSSQVQEICRVVLVIDDGAHDIRSIVAFAAAAEVIFKVVIQLEGLPTLQYCGAVKSPPIQQSARSHFRQVVAEYPGKTVWHVKG